jgi:GDP-4-dehydro-6-deoxy-D-mannose reductase
MLAERAPWCPVLITRSFNHAGPRQSDAFVTSNFARQIAEIERARREPVLRVGNLEARRDLTDVRDTVRAYRLIVQHGQPRRPYNVCSGRAHSIAELLDVLIGLSRVKVRVEVDPSRLRPSEVPILVGNASRLQHETGWRPEIPIERTLADLLDYWRNVISETIAQ